LEKNNWVELKNAKIRDREVNRLANYCIRDLFKHDKDNDRRIINFLKVYQCEKIGDVYKDMAQTFSEEKIKSDKKFLEYHREIEKFFDEIYKYSFNPTVDQAVKIEMRYKRLKKILEKKMLKSSEFKTLFFLRSLINKMMVLHEIELGHLKGL